MTSGITYRTPLSTPAARLGGVAAALRRLRQQAWFRWLDEVPAALLEDVAPGPHGIAAELRSEVHHLDDALHVRFY